MSARSGRNGRASLVQPATSDSFSDVVPGEGGEPDMPTNTTVAADGEDYGYAPSWDDDSMPDWSASDGSSTVAGMASLRLEVAVLAIDAVDRISSAIAERVSAVAVDAKLKGVVLVDPSALAVLRLRAALSGELGMLEARIAAAEAASAGSSAALLGPAVGAMALQGIKGAARSFASALSVFQVTSAVSGKKDLVRTSALFAAVAKHLRRHGVEAQVPRYAVMPPAGTGFVDRALEVQRKCRELSSTGAGGPEIDAASQLIDQLLQQLFGAGTSYSLRPEHPGRLAQQLAEADIAAAALEEGFGLLAVELALTAGSYRAKKWIFNALFGHDGLTYNGGAAATFFLLAGDRMAALASDTIYYASGHGRFRGQSTSFDATNIPGRAPGRQEEE